ncbi:hypothetical protein BP00DRAFT_222795 [Aspergillus indologenus CBS 114.80]|uniref:Uncharacterized protein n=1 Tax=Aspergillus indologenus CBS 114.80 TaxID=1450541 RepID=A0A2V5IZG7_9EURO|nr:hypothetical protein BP00DRAFT_222795 [Aspergillus indologenus CBS 114.80]
MKERDSPRPPGEDGKKKTEFSSTGPACRKPSHCRGAILWKAGERAIDDDRTLRQPPTPARTSKHTMWGCSLAHQHLWRASRLRQNSAPRCPHDAWWIDQPLAPPHRLDPILQRNCAFLVGPVTLFLLPLGGASQGRIDILIDHISDFFGRVGYSLVERIPIQPSGSLPSTLGSGG